MKTNVLIIGLPGSGKTYLAQAEYPDHILFDDFLFTAYNGKLEAAIKEKRLVCMTEPRLIIPDLFKRYTTKFGLTPDNTHLVVFENDPEKCIQNNLGRNRNVENAIRQYSQLYNLDTFDGWDFTTKPVF